MKNIVMYALVLITLFSCDNSLQLALPGILTTQRPATNPAPGLYHNDLTGIELLSLTEGAKIYYTTDNSTPNSSSQLYQGPLPLEGHHSALYIRAIAIKEGKEHSPEMTAYFYIEYSGPEVPSFSVERVSDSGDISPRADGSYDQDIRVTIIPETLINNDPESLWNDQGKSVEILYTTDGTTPMTNETGTPTGTTSKYSGGNFTVTGSTPLILKSRAVVDGFPASIVLTATYEVRYDQSLAGTVVFSEPEGTTFDPISLILSTPSGTPSGTEIHYSLTRSKDGEVTEQEDLTYSGVLNLFTERNNTEEITLTAWMEKDQWQKSAEVTRHYSFSSAQPQAPEINVLIQGYEGSILIPQGSTLADYYILYMESGVEGNIYYTLDDSIPDVNSNLYDGWISLSNLPIDWTKGYVVINAVMIRGGITSPIGSSWYLLP